MTSRRWRVRAGCLVAAGLFVGGCAGMLSQPSDTTPSGEERAGRRADREQAQRQLAIERAKREELERTNQKLQETVAKQATCREEDDKLARWQMQSFEKEALNRDLKTQLEQAILEVVRAKAKLRSLESKAEAASNLAEAELAMKTLKGRSAGHEPDADSERAEVLLKLGADEFKKENYGGALYVTSQAKTLIRESQERSLSREHVSPVQGESAFTLPVPLRLVGNGKFREHPALSAKTLTTLEDGTPIVGYSYKGQWVHVRTEDGRIGWVHASVVEIR